MQQPQLRLGRETLIQPSTRAFQLGDAERRIAAPWACGSDAFDQAAHAIERMRAARARRCIGQDTTEESFLPIFGRQPGASRSSRSQEHGSALAIALGIDGPVGGISTQLAPDASVRSPACPSFEAQDGIQTWQALDQAGELALDGPSDLRGGVARTQRMQHRQCVHAITQVRQAHDQDARAQEARFCIICCMLAALLLAWMGDGLWSRQPAAHFTEAYPLGNGRLGAMVFGGTEQERIVLNEISMWSGTVQDADRPQAHTALPKIVERLRAGDNPGAEALVNQHFTCTGAGSGHGQGKDTPFGCYQTLGNLLLSFPNLGTVSEYKRELDLDRAVVRTSLLADGHWFTREVFVSHPAQLIAVRLSSETPGQLNCDLSLQRSERASIHTPDSRSLAMEGALASGIPDQDGLRFAARLVAFNQGGTLEARDGQLSIRAADSAWILLGARTNYPGPIAGDFAGSRYLERLQADLMQGERQGWSALQNAHEAAHQALYRQSRLDLGGSDAERLPTAERLAAYHRDDWGHWDDALAALIYSYGRYLLISSSRRGSLPANLQGLWAEEYQTPWNGDYHLNINVQMNYWPAEVAGLAECHEPLLRLVEALVAPGQRTARAYYNAPGWVAHVITNVWGFTSPGEQASWGSTNTGGAWLCRHLAEQEAFAPDLAFLKRIYPTLKGASEFYLASLVEHGPERSLVTAVSNSPENAFRLPDGRTANTCMGPTMDLSLVRELFSNTIAAARRLGVDARFAGELQAARERLAPLRIAPDGRLAEWLEDYAEVEPQHRHVSHLYDLYPGSGISPLSTPQLAAAARRSLEARGDGGTGWSMAWKIAFWARLKDGDRALQLLRNLLYPTGQSGYHAGHGGTYPNLFCAHPPFQIDGSFGATAAIAELLLQSQAIEGIDLPFLQLLPALPSQWDSGRVSGLRARGGIRVDMSWEQGRLSTVTLERVRGPRGAILVRADVEIQDHPADAQYQSFRIELEPGQRVVLRARQP